MQADEIGVGGEDNERSPALVEGATENAVLPDHAFSPRLNPRKTGDLDGAKAILPTFGSAAAIQRPQIEPYALGNRQSH
ncbi:hypothetical protein GGE07_005669 [Sinorhizobium terangae]|uniref:Uncharacterized protein n=1 Tax=Sinorhizobium terangae TaxID=110322 RepID=A0A6N7LH90_SINTE|nr:hypothetical protein [Sinorhizobium terangae]MBB4188990.1 hypothetical protein [Sinorhizobium terangae]MQX16265.1 hypothetical protein [Sinorhizobium terangae]